MSFGLGLGLGFGALCVSCSMVSLFFSPPGSVQLVSSCCSLSSGVCSGSLLPKSSYCRKFTGIDKRRTLEARGSRRGCRRTISSGRSLTMATAATNPSTKTILRFLAFLCIFFLHSRYACVP